MRVSNEQNEPLFTSLTGRNIVKAQLALNTLVLAGASRAFETSAISNFSLGDKKDLTVFIESTQGYDFTVFFRDPITGLLGNNGREAIFTNAGASATNRPDYKNVSNIVAEHAQFFYANKGASDSIVKISLACRPY